MMYPLTRTHLCFLTVLLYQLSDHLVTSILVMGSEKYPVASKSGKICIGTNGRMSVPSNREHHYQNLRDRYTNCTYVDGNLELTWLQDKNLDLSFLQDIREVTGYVLISHVDVKRIVLPNLQIIRGRTLFKLNVRDEEFALMVTFSNMENLEMPALRDILAGSVGFFNNYNLCHIRTINWEEILTGPKAKTIYVYNFTQPERECPSCHESCEDGCWGEGSHNCQKFSKINCSPQCHQGRCFGPNPRECCHLFCAGGCTGPKQSDCLACRNFHDDGVCKQECPPMMKYNPSTYSWEMNPEGKYAYGATCVKVCPDHLLKDNGACVRSCPPNKKNNNRGECVPCDGPCPKNCQGVDVVHAGNIDTFKECTIIEGSLTILDTSFEGFQEVYPNFTFGPRHPRMHPDRLDVFSTLKQVTGFVSIQASHPDFKNLSYFRNLEEIGGRQLTEYFAALYIVKTSLVSLNLRALKKVRAGSVAILENKDLCFAKSIDWKKVRRSNTHSILLQSNGDEDSCRIKGLVCDPQCASDGCWGPGPDECLSCRSYKLGDTCIEGCNTSQGIYDSGNRICKHCHEECLGECYGPGANNCTVCRNVRDGPYCVGECPVSKYNERKECKSCHDNCVGGCSGAKNTVGKGGCNSCEKAIVSMYDPNVVEQCLKAEEPCPDGFYHEYIGPQEEGALKSLTGKSVCRKCHQRCKNCTAYGIHTSVCECSRYSSGEQCEDQCPRDHFADEVNHRCVKCNDGCRGCTGPLSSDCIACRNYRVYSDNDDGRFNCTMGATCPSEKPYKVFDDKSNEDPFCSDKDPASAPINHEEEQMTALVLGVVSTIFLIGVFLAFCCYQWYQRAKVKENTMKLTIRMAGFEDNEPLKLTNIKPNLAKLRIVKEAELRRGAPLGYGAFGTVYKGVWSPEGDNVKIPVAIKVLKEGTQSSMNKEFLEEAYIMASVDNPNLLKLLAVCMTSQLMLVTQLMPLGCLLDFVRKNKDRIGSKPLLNWCTQISRGMAYLEERRMVHRDLALRNVLLQNPGCIKITDFGLAKLLDSNEEEYRAAGGKMPIKWLAPECIHQRIFTHKSDVWAFGVTVWELLTYGDKPYEGIKAKDVVDRLMAGDRLPQPSICTIDVFKTLLQCWILTPESRPTFKELSDEFARMARDPGRFLVITGDKLMRLPTYSQKDEMERVKSICSTMIEGADELVDAEEYLQPSKTHFRTGDTPPPPTPIKKFMEDRGFEGEPLPYHSCDPLAGPSQLDLLDGRHGFFNTMQTGRSLHSRCSHFDGTSLMYNQYPHGKDGSYNQYPHGKDGSYNSSRYCSDPVRLNAADLNGVFFHPAGDMTDGKTLVRLPVDEDDYLVPSPGHLGHSSAYMDLIGDTRTLDPNDPNIKEYMGYIRPDFKSLHGIPRCALDNLEYHLMQRDNEYINTSIVGGTSCSTSTSTVPSGGAMSAVSMPPNAQVNGPPFMNPSNPVQMNGASLVPGIGASSLVQMNGASLVPVNGASLVPVNGHGGRKKSSTDEEDDHEYYNDYDARLKRELQPLNQQHRRNETTV